jgi:hypothetical protein
MTRFSHLLQIFAALASVGLGEPQGPHSRRESFHEPMPGKRAATIAPKWLKSSASES